MTVPTVNLTFPSGPVKSSSFSGGLFINNEFVSAQDGGTFEVINPTTGKKIADVAEGKSADVDRAVAAAEHAMSTTWGLNCPGAERGKLLFKLADAIDSIKDELAAIESIDNGKPRSIASSFDVTEAAANLRYAGGWSDKYSGKVQELNEGRMAIIRHEPIGVVGQIIPWNFPLLMLAWKLGPALSMGNAVVLKTSETTPLSALRVCALIKDIFPPGVVNVISGFGKTAGVAIAEHPKILKVAFTGSTLVGKSILKAAANTNLKKVTLELGGKSPNILFEDCDLSQSVRWAAFGLFFNMGQCCCAGSRVYVQESIYDKFMTEMEAHIKTLKQGNPFEDDTFLGPQNSQLQFDRIMAHIAEGKKEGKLVTGGKRKGTEGYFIEPTIFTDVKPDARIAREEIFGPVIVVQKFQDEDDLIRIANNSVYGLAAAVFTRDISRALKTANKLHSGTVWINCYNQLHAQVPFGGYKESGIGRELGEYALANYTQVKSIIINLERDNAP